MKPSSGSEEARGSGPIGTRGFIAPELERGAEEFTFACDAYSMGKVLEYVATPCSELTQLDFDSGAAYASLIVMNIPRRLTARNPQRRSVDLALQKHWELLERHVPRGGLRLGMGVETRRVFLRRLHETRSAEEEVEVETERKLPTAGDSALDIRVDQQEQEERERKGRMYM